MTKRTNLRHLLAGSLLALAALPGCFKLDWFPDEPAPNPFMPPPIMCSADHLADTSGEVIDLCASGSVVASKCTPTEAECKGVGSRCLALNDPPEGATFALRMSQITFAQPSIFERPGTVSVIVPHLVRPARDGCHLDGQGSFSWLLRFDLDAGTLTTGGAPPPADPDAPYAFLQGAVDDHGVKRFITPAGAKLELAPPCAFSATVSELVLPMFTDVEGTKVVFIPLHQVHLQGSLSDDHRCIGAYEPRALDRTCCADFGDRDAFHEGGTVDGYFLLEEADTFNAGIYDASLCVFLADSLAAFSDGAVPFERCKRDAQGKIVFQGDWCSATNAPATADCADALRFAATFAASGVPFVE
jgi:hypothetical protein